MSNFVVLIWGPVEYKTRSEKRPFLYRAKILIFNIFFKTLQEESFKDLRIKSN